MLNELRKHIRFIKTMNLYLCFFVFGLSVSLLGPCLLDLQHLVRTDAQHIAMIYTARSGGFLLGAIIGGNVMCLELWGKDSKSVIQGLHFAYSLGGLVSPLIAAPFLQTTSEFPRNTNNTIYNTSSLNEYLVDTTASVPNVSANFSLFSEDAPKLIYPFSIVAAVTLLVTIFHLGVFLLSPTDEESLKDESKTDDSKISSVFMFFTVIFTFLLYFVVGGTETGYGQTITIYSVKGKLHLTATQGSYITSAFWVALTLTRLLCMLLAMKIGCLKLLIGDICLVSLAAIGLLFLMSNELTLWLASLTLGIGIATAYGVVISWISTQMHISSKFSSTFAVGAAAGEIIVPFIIIYFIDTDPEMFCYIPAAAAILMIILISPLFCMFKYKSKLKISKNADCSVAEETETRN